MYRTSSSIRITSAALAAVFGLGLVATAGGALREAQPKVEALPMIYMEPVVIRLHQPPHIAAEQAPKTAL